MTAQLFGDLLDLTGRHAVHVHLGKCGHQRLFRALIALEQLGRETPIAVLGDPQLELAHTRDQRAVIISRAVAKATRRALALPRRQRLGHLRFEQFLQQISDNLAELVAVAAHQVFCRRNK